MSKHDSTLEKSCTGLGSYAHVWTPRQPTTPSQQLLATPPMSSKLVARMTAALLLGLFLVFAEAAPQDLTTTGPGGGEEMDCEKMYNGLWTMKE